MFKLTDTVKETLVANIASGIALLDEEKPGWRASVDVEAFDINSTRHCVLGQVYDGYFGGLNQLGLSHFNDYGFNYTQALSDAMFNGGDEWDDDGSSDASVMAFLQEEWVKALA